MHGLCVRFAVISRSVRTSCRALNMHQPVRPDSLKAALSLLASGLSRLLGAAPPEHLLPDLPGLLLSCGRSEMQCCSCGLV